MEPLRRTEDAWAHLRPARSDAAPIVHLIDLSDDDGRVDAEIVRSSEQPAEFADLEEVYRRTYPSLVRTAYLLVDTREQAEEVVQDAFARAFPKWSRLRTPDAYLRACVVNGCRRVHRRRRLVARMPQPAVDLSHLDEGDHIADLVRSLPSPQREAVVMRYYLQATDQEIADALRIALGTVKSTLHRARNRLREELT